MAENGVGKALRQKEERYSLPKGVEKENKEVLRYTGLGWRNTPMLVKPLEEKDEREIIHTLINEARSSFGVKVSNNLVLDRAGVKPKKTAKYTVLGGSNADRLGRVMKNLGNEVVRVTSPGWRPTEKEVEEMMDGLKGKVLKESTVIVMGMDNSMFYAEDENGESTLPRKDKNNHYHVAGSVQVASCRRAKQLVGN